MTHFNWIILSCFLIVVTISMMVQGLEEESQGNHHHYHQEESQVRLKRDVIKGKNHALTRSKRYIGRVPVAYMKKAMHQLEPYDEDEDNIVAGSPQKQSPAVSHFREFQMRQGGNYNNKPGGSRDNELTLEEPRALPSGGLAQSHKNQRRYIPNLNAVPRTAAADGDASTLTDEDIQTLLLMLDGYELNENNPNEPKNPRVQSVRPEQYYSYLSPIDLERVAQMYAVGKRETGKKRSTKNYEQPMSFDNSLYPGDKLEFLNEKRKRIGAQNLMAKTTSSNNRFKKETDPAVVATLEKVFTQQQQANTEKASTSTNSNNNNPSQNNSPIHEMMKEKSKKDIDWSNYLGIDKRSNDKTKSEQGVDAQERNEQNKKIESPQSDFMSPSSLSNTNIKSSQIVSASSPSVNSVVSGGVNKDKVKQSNDKAAQQRKENETHNKEEDDRNWILQEFYKNFAMSTNVKRKRESPSSSLKPKTELEKLEDLEKKMSDAGDKIIWDALKYTGSHRDEKLSPNELAKIKSNIIQKLSTAYSLEKVRETVDELREEVLRLEERQKIKA